MDTRDIQKLLTAEEHRLGRLQRAVESLNHQIVIVEQQLGLWRNIIALRTAEVELQGPISGALQLLTSDDVDHAPNRAFPRAKNDANDDSDEDSDADGGESAGISRTLGKRVYAAIASYLNQPGRQKATVEVLYEVLGPELQAEIESIQSSKSPIFRFRRLLRRNKDDFSVERSGIVTYLHYAAPDDYGADFPAAPEHISDDAPLLTIFGKRFDVRKGWVYQFTERGDDTFYEANATYVLDQLSNPFRTAALRLDDGSLIGVAPREYNGVVSLGSYENRKWTTDLDYGLHNRTSAPSMNA